MWPLLPLFGVRAATFEGGVLAFGTIIAVAQTVTKPSELVYLLEYEDGDVRHLAAREANAAEELALANTPTRRTLRRQNADADLPS